MSNPKRKICMMKRIDAITPIEGADKIECAHIGGWTCVVGKGEFEPGELCVYIEPDAFLPTSDPRYAKFASRGERTMTIKGNPTLGHVLKVARLRGQISQGLALKPQEALPESVPEYAYERMYESKARLDGICNVCEYHPDESSLAAGFIGKYNPRFGPRTNAERVQNIDQETFDLVKRTSYWTSVKVDGTSITICCDGDRIRAFSHNNEFDLDKPGQGQLVIETARRQGIIDFLKAHPYLSCQAELCGPKIGGNTLRLKEYRLFVFSIWDTENRVYVPPFELGNVTDGRFVRELEQSLVPYVGSDVGEDFLDQFDTPQDLIEWTNGLRGSVAPNVLDEGVVVHVYDMSDLDNAETTRLWSALGEQMQMKSVSSAFLLKKKG